MVGSYLYQKWNYDTHSIELHKHKNIDISKGNIIRCLENGNKWNQEQNYLIQWKQGAS